MTTACAPAEIDGGKCAAVNESETAINPVCCLPTMLTRDSTSWTASPFLSVHFHEFLEGSLVTVYKIFITRNVGQCPT